MNVKDTIFPLPMPAAERAPGLGEALDAFEDGVARSFAEGSRLAGLLMQLLAMLREALARFGTSVSVDTVLTDLAAVSETDSARVRNVARPMRVRGIWVAPGLRVTRGVVAPDGVALGVVSVAQPPRWASARDAFSAEHEGFEWGRFSKSACPDGQFCALFVALS